MFLFIALQSVAGAVLAAQRQAKQHRQDQDNALHHRDFAGDIIDVEARFVDDPVLTLPAPGAIETNA